MNKIAQDQEQHVELLVDTQLGLNNAVQPTSLKKGMYLLMKNAYQNKSGSNAKRPGSAPYTNAALGNPIKHVTEYRSPMAVSVGVAPVLSSVTAGASTLPTATYFVRYTFVTLTGETEASAQASRAIVLGKTLRIVIPTLPAHVFAAAYYISTSSNTETLQFTTNATTYDLTVPLVSGASYPTVNTTLAIKGELLASSGTDLYVLYEGSPPNYFSSITMTNALVTSDIYTVAFKNLALTSILFITDGGSVKKYNGSAVSNITPAADDASPAPVNHLAALNSLAPIYCWVFKGFLFISTGDDSAWHSKLFEFDYFPSTFTTRYVRNNDQITGCGVPFGEVCLIPMRSGWGITTFSESVSTLMTGNQFLNTKSGSISPRAIQKVNYPDGTQTIVYLSVDGVYEIYDTGFIDSGIGSRNLSTRALMKDKVDFNSYGFTEAEKQAATGAFDSTLNIYILNIARASTKYAFVYDVRNREWYLWDGLDNNVTIRYNDYLFYGGDSGYLYNFDDTLATDYTNYARTTGTIVDWDCYTDMIALEDTGYQSYLDYLLVWAKSYSTPSTIDVTIVAFDSTTSIDNAVLDQYLIWDEGTWDNAVWANLDFTSKVIAPPRILVKKKSVYFQIRFRNPRDELVELYKYKLIGRVSGG